MYDKEGNYIMAPVVAASGAVTGGSIGSIVPGIGTALGAGIGGLAGYGYGTLLDKGTNYLIDGVEKWVSKSSSKRKIR